ncbi:MAG: antibiotic biosynthesis monooxygenase [Candidatus Sericytochromatia bacterium]|nr:antibiotic biosynthesis monooxygenase [Candidatus Sericytochromatia bacterium]
MPLYRTAQFIVRPGAVYPCQEPIQAFIAYVKANEPGTLLYVSLQDSDDPTRFMHVFAFADAAAETAHQSSAAFAHFTGSLAAFLVSQAEVEEFGLIAST